MNKKTILSFFIFFLLVFLAIMGQMDTVTLSTASVTQKPKEITLGGYRDVTPGKNFFYPASSICFTWESLVGVRRNSWEPIPVLAESWKMSPDGKRWVFYLRKGISFHDGKHFDANAVLANFDRYLKASGKIRFYRFRMDRFYPGFSSIEKLDDFSIALNFNSAIPTLPYYMANWGSTMFSPACFDKVTGEFTKKPAGTGPYRVVEHVADQYAVLERFEAYWKEKAKSKKIRIKVIPAVNTRYSAMKSEEIYSTLDLGGMTPALAEELLKDQRFKLSVAKNSIVHFIALNGEKFPFNDLRMKQAVSMIIDRSLISEEFYHGYFPIAANILSYASPFYKEIPDPHDPEKARQFARQVLGSKIIPIDLVFPSNLLNYPYKETAQYLQSILSELGLQVSIRQLESGSFNDTIMAGDFHLYLRRQGLPHSEAMGIFNDYMRLKGQHGMNSETQNKRYHYNYYNPKAESLLDQATKTLNLDQRRNLYFELQDLAAETIPIIPLVYEATLIINNKKIVGHNAMIYGSTLDSIDWAH